jgi:hypothetical protein
MMNVESTKNGHEVELPPVTTSPKPLPSPSPVAQSGESKKKKKGIFGGLFGGKKGKKSKDGNDKSERTASRTRGLRSPMARKMKNTSESSI